MTKSIPLILGSLLWVMVGACTWLTGAAPASPDVGQLRVYTTLNQDEVALYLEDFQIAYPDIQVAVEQMTAPALLARLLAERGAPQADLIWGVGLTSVLYLEWNDLLKPYTPVGLNRVESRFRDTNHPPIWVGNTLALTALCVNPDELVRLNASIPTTWQDLLDPRFRRAILMANPTTTETGLMALLGLLELAGEQAGWRYLDELHPNIAFYTPTETDPCTLVERGEYAIAIAKAVESRGKMQIVYLSGKSGWELKVSALARKDTVTPAARTFLDWSIGDPVMRLYARKNALTAAPTGLTPPAGYPPDPTRLLIDRNIPWAAANRERILLEWAQRYGDKVKP